jgi:hypothetical protein
MLILADNDVVGAVTALQRILKSDDWIEVCEILDLTFIQFEDLELPRNASDHDVWWSCQNAGAVLITGNRASGDKSLEKVIRDHGDEKCWPVITIGDPQRVIRNHEYAEECALGLVDLLERIERLRGTGRLFIP